MAADFPDEYIDRIFYIWYENDRKSGNWLMSSIPEAPDGRKPATITVNKWIHTLGWEERADALDAEVSRKADELIINKRIEMIEKHAKIGEELIKKGMDFLKEEGKGIKTDASAIRAIDLGLSTERASVGLADAVRKISTMSDEELTNSVLKLLGKKTDENAIDAEYSDTES